jgi:hypothetical protein
MSMSSQRAYWHRRRNIHRVKRVSLVLVSGIAIGAAAGLAAGIGFGLFQFTLFDAVRSPAEKDKTYPASASSNPEADYWRALAKMAEEKALQAEQAPAEKAPPKCESQETRTK